MSDEKQTELTPQEQEQQDEQRVHGQLLVTDVKRTFETVFGAFGFGGGSSGRTSFEGHELNAMIDLIENSNPADLENAGKALLDARDALNDAAKELSDSIKAVDWEGESGTAFRDWGNSLVTHTENLGKFAQAAGTQITVAGTGLASVRNSLPPRDTRLNRRKPEEVEAPKRVEGNPEYQAALKVEKDRQEAINQANRLASYYAVSEEALAGQEPPRFDKKLDVAMPRPSGGDHPGDSRTESPVVTSPTGVRAPDESARYSAVREVATGPETPGLSRTEVETSTTLPVPDRSVSTEINSVAPPQAPVMPSSAPPSAPPVNPVGPPGPSAPPLANNFVNPVPTGPRWSQGTTGAPRPVQPTTGGPKTVGPVNSNGPAANRSAGAPVGRPSPTTSSPAAGTPGRAGGATQPPMGRPSVMGGNPTTSGPAGRTGTTGVPTGRASGIVGGTPQRAVPGRSSSAGSHGVPRGTVIGAGSASRTPSPPGGTGQRGVIGSTGTGAATRSGGRGTPSTSGVVGTPRGGVTGRGLAAKGFTAGGAGLVRGPASRPDSDDEDQEGSRRPDYLTEDRETWEAGRRGTAPPVIE
ncbi:hypothetical protein [Streptomyces nitrosporeus]|uniref:hypothetical protein n=1 Tax=Streptomyces nitrosporeus TaxID=28894 RepID=UPI00332082E3